MVDVRELLLQRTPGTELYQFDLFISRPRPDEQHFYCHGLSAADFADVFRRDLAGRVVYVTRFSPALLNPSYWERSTAAAEQEVKAKTGGLIVKEEAGARFVFRSDHVPKGRLLKEGAGVEPELVNGTVLRVAGNDFPKLAEALQPLRDDVQFVAVESTGNHQLEMARRAVEDARALRRSSREVAIIYSSRGNHITQVVFSTPALLLKALEAAIRGFAHRISRQHVAHINQKVLEDLATVLERVGAVCYSHRDFLVKDTQIEMTLHRGKSEWPPDVDFDATDQKLLIYYDRTAGIWAYHL